jgi:hypothetical protein
MSQLHEKEKREAKREAKRCSREKNEDKISSVILNNLFEIIKLVHTHTHIYIYT